MLFRVVKNLCLMLVVITVPSCTGPRATPTPHVVQVALLTVEAGQPLIEGTAATFNAAQPTMEVRTRVAAGTTQAVQQLCRGEAVLILVDRSLTDGERATCTANNNPIVDFYVAEQNERTFVFLAHEEILRPGSPAATYLAFLFATEDLPLAIEQLGFTPAPVGTYEENLGTLQILLDRSE